MSDLGNVIPFGRTPAEREHNAHIAQLDAEAARSQADHPAGRKRPTDPTKAAEAAAFVPHWRSQYPSTTEERRANILAGKPRCKCCERPFSPRARPPPDLVCMGCRRDMLHQGPADPPPDPALF